MIRAVMLATGPKADQWVGPCVQQWRTVTEVAHLPKTRIMRYPRVEVTFWAESLEDAEAVAARVSAYMGLSLGRARITGAEVPE